MTVRELIEKLSQSHPNNLDLPVGFELVDFGWVEVSGIEVVHMLPDRLGSTPNDPPEGGVLMIRWEHE